MILDRDLTLASDARQRRVTLQALVSCTIAKITERLYTGFQLSIPFLSRPARPRVFELGHESKRLIERYFAEVFAKFMLQPIKPD